MTNIGQIAERLEKEAHRRSDVNVSTRGSTIFIKAGSSPLSGRIIALVKADGTVFDGQGSGNPILGSYNHTHFHGSQGEPVGRLTGWRQMDTLAYILNQSTNYQNSTENPDYQG